MTRFFILCCVFSFLSFGLFAQDKEIALADEYFSQQAWDKAVAVYAKIAKDDGRVERIHQKYFFCLLKLGDAKESEKYLKKRLKDAPLHPQYNVDYARLLQASGNEVGAKAHIEAYLSQIKKDDTRLKNVAIYLIDARFMELAEQAYLQGKRNGTEFFDFDLAELYGTWGKKEAMLSSYLNALEFADASTEGGAMGEVQDRLIDKLSADEDWKLLEGLLYQYVQRYPDQLAYTRMLVWYYLQKKQFFEAFKQARSVDKRLKMEGAEIMQIANLAYNNEAFDDAAKIYAHLIEKYPTNGYIYMQAKNMLIQSKEAVVKRTYPIDMEKIQSLAADYEASIAEFGIKNNTASAVCNLARLQAFYLNKPDSAVALLERMIKTPRLSIDWIDGAKLELGDVYVLKHEPWEAVLIYAQVEKSQTDKLLGHEAKLRNAKLSYYTGDFELAKAHLDVLKMATSREIANDAMDLSWLIEDNLELDTSDTALREYAEIDMLAFQGVYQEAINRYADMLTRYKAHSLTDEILWSRANMLFKLGKMEEALVDLQRIITEYGFDIRADDALFLSGKICEDYLKDKDKALGHYVELLTNHPGSIYVTEARKRTRLLRGDRI